MSGSDESGNFEIPVDESVDGAVDAEVEAELAQAFGAAERVSIVDGSVDGPSSATGASSEAPSDGDPTGRWSRLRKRVTRDSDVAERTRREDLEVRAEVLEKRLEARAERMEKRLELRAETRAERDAARRVEPRPERQRVVIKDDTAQPVKVSGEARFRQRRIAVRRQEGRRRLWWVVVAGSAALVVLIVLLLLTSPILSVRRVSIEGVAYADPEQVGEIVASLKGDPILTADLHEASKALESIPWIEKARVSMHLPSTVHIEVVERKPLAFYRAVDGFNRVIDLDGRVLDVIEGDLVDYPFIGGTGPNLSAGELVGQPFLGAVQLINALPRELRVRLVTAAVSADGEVSLALTDEVDVLFGNPEGFQEKLVALVNAIKREGSSRYSVIDVSSGEASVR